MIRTFVEIPLFSKRWKEIGLTDEALLDLQLMILKDPESGPIIEGTGGIRKIRFALGNKGKSAGIRVCYVDLPEFEVTYLITAFEKSEKENLAKGEKNTLKKLVKSLIEEACRIRGAQK